MTLSCSLTDFENDSDFHPGGIHGERLHHHGQSGDSRLISSTKKRKTDTCNVLPAKSAGSSQRWRDSLISAQMRWWKYARLYARGCRGLSHRRKIVLFSGGCSGIQQASCRVSHLRTGLVKNPQLPGYGSENAWGADVPAVAYHLPVAEQENIDETELTSNFKSLHHKSHNICRYWNRFKLLSFGYDYPLSNSLKKDCIFVSTNFRASIYIHLELKIKIHLSW